MRRRRRPRDRHGMEGIPRTGPRVGSREAQAATRVRRTQPLRSRPCACGRDRVLLHRPSVIDCMSEQSARFSSWRERVDVAGVLVVGDVMLDRYWFGDVERISPEAPVAVAKIARTEERPGGAANVARNVAALGAHARLLSVMGDDEAGN